MTDLRKMIGAFAANAEALAGDGARVTVILRTPGRPDADFVSTIDDDLDAVIALLERRKVHDAEIRARNLALARAM